MYNVVEATGPVSGANAKDLDQCLAILMKIFDFSPNGIRVKRLGKFTGVKPRPILVSFPSVDIVRNILAKKYLYKGPVAIAADRTISQRNGYAKVKKKMEEMMEKNPDLKKRIVYRNGLPVIIDTKRMPSKNGEDQAAN